MRKRRVKKSSSSSSSGGGGDSSGNDKEKKAKVLFPGDDKHGGSVRKWMVRENQSVDAGDVLCKCAVKMDDGSVPVIDVIAPYDGTILELYYKEKQDIENGTKPILRMSYCLHDIIIASFGLCGVCGRQPSQLNAVVADSAASYFHKEEDMEGSEDARFVDPAKDSISANMTVNVGENKIIVSRDEAEVDRNRTIERLLEQKKLLLVMDIDHTMLHATDDPRAVAYVKSRGLSEQLHTFQLKPYEGAPDSMLKDHFVMLRPGLIPWLEEIGKLYELYIYTAGTRGYAEAVAKVFDPKQDLFGTRIISRTDVPELGKFKRLERFFPIDNSMVLAVDDRSDVWDEDASNLITIKPYHFFPQTMHEVNNASGPEFDLKGDEEEDKKNLDRQHIADRGLKRAGELLKWVHEKFFDQAKQIKVDDQINGKGGDVKKLLRELRKRIFRGVHASIGLESDEAANGVSALVQACGGVAHMMEIVPETEVVIASNPNAKLAQEGKAKSLWVVHPDYVHACVHNWNKERFDKYSIFALYTKTAEEEEEEEAEGQTKKRKNEEKEKDEKLVFRGSDTPPPPKEEKVESEKHVDDDAEQPQKKKSKKE